MGYGMRLTVPLFLLGIVMMIELGVSMTVKVP